MNTLTKVVVAVFLVRCSQVQGRKDVSQDKVEVRHARTHSHVPLGIQKEVKSSQIDLNIYNLLNKARSTT